MSSPILVLKERTCFYLGKNSISGFPLLLKKREHLRLRKTTFACFKNNTRTTAVLKPRHIQQTWNCGWHFILPQFLSDFYRVQELQMTTKASIERTRRTLSQFQSLAIRRPANFMKFRNVMRRVLKLPNCERARREGRKNFSPFIIFQNRNILATSRLNAFFHVLFKPVPTASLPLEWGGLNLGSSRMAS